MLEIIEYLNDNNGALMVIITLVYVVATIAICVANLRSAKATRDQLEESKRQYEEEHRAFISYEFIYERRTWYGLRFTNHGKRVANNVQLHLDREFIESLTERLEKVQLQKLEGKQFSLGIEQSYDIFFGGDQFRVRPNKIPIQGTVTYSDWKGTYTDTFEIDFEKYPPIFTVETDAEKMEKKLKELNDGIMRIAGELKKIDAHIAKSDSKNN